MPRELTEAGLGALSDRVVRMEYLFAGALTGQTLRLWTGLGNLSYAGQTYLGNGWLVSPASVTQTAMPFTHTISVLLSGVPASLIEMALNDTQYTRVGSLRVVFLDASESVIDSLLLFSGYLDRVDIYEGADETNISMAYEAKTRRLIIERDIPWSNAYQRSAYPGDKGFEYLVQLNSKSIYWGRQDMTRQEV